MTSSTTFPHAPARRSFIWFNEKAARSSRLHIAFSHSIQKEQILVARVPMHEALWRSRTEDDLNNRLYVEKFHAVSATCRLDNLV